nr:MAG TPA: hypothetical protein [Caudoviricetes sp.]
MSNIVSRSLYILSGNKLYSDYRAIERVLAHIGQKVYLPMPRRGDIGRRPSISV